MKSTRARLSVFLVIAALVMGISLHPEAHALVRLAKDWPSGFTADHRPLLGMQSETGRFRLATEKLARSLNAIPKWGSRDPILNGIGFKLFIDDVKYYIDPVMFMARERPDEVCTPKRFSNTPTYMCEEGQRLAYSCHLFFYDANLQPIGVYRLKIDEPYRYFCNAMPALGVADRDRNELLVTVQYFNIDNKPASKAGKIGSGWNRMTLLFKVKLVDGKIEVEQDDTCLKNPNHIEEVPDARKRLGKCEAAGK